MKMTVGPPSDTKTDNSFVSPAQTHELNTDMNSGPCLPLLPISHPLVSHPTQRSPVYVTSSLFLAASRTCLTPGPRLGIPRPTCHTLIMSHSLPACPGCPISFGPPPTAHPHSPC